MAGIYQVLKAESYKNDASIVFLILWVSVRFDKKTKIEVDRVDRSTALV